MVVARPHSVRIDVHELMAEDLEVRQQQRYRHTKFKDSFFDRQNEVIIRDRIKMLRMLSETYNAANER